MHQDDHIDNLIAKLAAGTLTDQELAELVAWYNSLDDTHVVVPVAHEDSVEQLRARMYQRLMAKVNPKPKRSIFVRLLPYAAAAVVAVLGIGYFLSYRLDQQVVDAMSVVQDIPPGGNRATLSLADGRVIDLSEAQEGIIIGDGITYLDGSTVVGEQVNEGTSEQGPGSPYAGRTANDPRLTTHDLQLTTPKGGTYQVTLSDGTKVWLNAASTLRYPGRFDRGERVVELIGEAYFDVSEQVNGGSQAHKLTGSQKIPFKVISNGQVVEVFGTQFNISAYPDDAEIKTTLVSGSVKVASNAGSMMLEPGQQSSVGADGIHVQMVKTAPFIAWKDGTFHFRRTPVEDVLKQVSRWYNVEVVYGREIPQETLSGKISRGVSLMGVLDILRLSTIDVKLEGRTLLVN